MAVAQPLLSYRELYDLWERQQWRVADLYFTRDRVDWHERFASDRRRLERMGLSGFFLGEQRVTRELGPMMRAAPSEDARLFLSTQIADEARHVAFFDRSRRRSTRSSCRPRPTAGRTTPSCWAARSASSARWRAASCAAGCR